MILPITRKPSPSTSKLPPQLAKLGSDEIVLIELQGSLEVEGVPDGQIVGSLKIDEKTVCESYVFRSILTINIGESNLTHWTPSPGGKICHITEATCSTSQRSHVMQW
jgi:hypothetical protein